MEQVCWFFHKAGWMNCQNLVFCPFGFYSQGLTVSVAKEFLFANVHPNGYIKHHYWVDLPPISLFHTNNCNLAFHISMISFSLLFCITLEISLLRQIDSRKVPPPEIPKDVAFFAALGFQQNHPTNPDSSKVDIPFQSLTWFT